MAKEIDIAGKLHAATTEGLVAEASQIHYAGGGTTVEAALAAMSGEGLPVYGSGFTDMAALLSAMKEAMPAVGVSRVTVGGLSCVVLHGRLSRQPNQLDTFALLDSEGAVWSTTYTMSDGTGTWGEWSSGGQGTAGGALLEAVVYDTEAATGATVSAFDTEAVQSADSAAVVWRRVNGSAGRFWLLLMAGSAETYVASWPSFSKDGRTTLPSSDYNEGDATTSGARTGVFFVFGREGYAVDGLYFRDPYAEGDELTAIPLHLDKASAAHDGLMSKEDKAKLDGIPEGGGAWPEYAGGKAFSTVEALETELETTPLPEGQGVRVNLMGQSVAVALRDVTDAFNEALSASGIQADRARLGTAKVYGGLSGVMEGNGMTAPTASYLYFLELKVTQEGESMTACLVIDGGSDAAYGDVQEVDAFEDVLTVNTIHRPGDAFDPSGKPYACRLVYCRHLQTYDDSNDYDEYGKVVLVYNGSDAYLEWPDFDMEGVNADKSFKGSEAYNVPPSSIGEANPNYNWKRWLRPGVVLVHSENGESRLCPYRNKAVATGELVRVSPQAGVSVVSHGTGDTTFELTPGVLHVWGEVASLTLTLAAVGVDYTGEYLFEFNSGATPTVLELPEEVKFAGSSVVAANKRYQVSILHGIALMVGVDRD